jgi:TIR domain
MTDAAFTHDVFLSHSSKDKAVVCAVAERLRADGLHVWFDGWELRPGDSIPAKIEDGLEHSRVLVLCMSANAFASDWAQLESGTFRFRDPLNKERRFIPLRLDDAPIKGSLAQFLYINCSRRTASRSMRGSSKPAGSLTRPKYSPAARRFQNRPWKSTAERGS